MLKAERDAAVAAVIEACRICRGVRETLVTDETLAKRDRSPVTVADYAAQVAVVLELAKSFPSDPVVAEEDAADLRAPENAAMRRRVLDAVQRIVPSASEEQALAALDRGAHTGGREQRFWALDPIDGTKGFLRGEQYAVALALIEEGRVVLGVLGCPNLPRSATSNAGDCGCLFVAERGCGAFEREISSGEETPIRAAAVTNPAAAVICESVESGHTAQDDSARIAQFLGVTAPPLRMDSQAKYAAVARGDASIYLRLPTRADYEERIWDHAAGWVVITEAGGQVTDVTGAPLDFSAGRTLRRNRGVVATNGALHEAVLDAVRSVLGMSG